MTEQIIREWLSEFDSITPAELHTFASTVHGNSDVITAVYTVLEERHKFSHLTEDVCKRLYSCYRSKEVDLQRFTLLFLPTLIYVYLNAVAHGEKKNCRPIEALLLGMYNAEVVDDNGQAKVIAFRLPSLAQASIYHEPMSLAPASLTESALRRLEECNSSLVRWGPLPQVERIIAQNRLTVTTALLFVYNRQLSQLPKQALDQLCKAASKLVTQGFNKPGKRVSYSSDVPRVLPRIPVTPQLLLELLHSVYFAMFNDYSYVAIQAVEDLHQRACYQCYTDVLLVTNAIKNCCSHFMHAGQTSDAPMGISMAISPATNTTTVSKSMITNASFRTKKLPDDIPIQVPKEGEGLGSISEEKEDSGGIGGGSGGIAPEVATRRSLPKMAVSFGKKTKEKLTKTSSSGSTKGSGGGGSIKGASGGGGGGGGLVNGSGDMSEPEENGDLASEMTALTISENGTDISTPINLRKGGQGGLAGSQSIDIDVSRSMQVSSV
ncbi:hyccin [Nilaparvata lugens]|uniref:hyccin n=1 Tax=Nilaparvata lugens TaxID=108931 RepID=UPI00193CDBF5|nr:hyccin [Nilaparvata lugens]XP_039292258.1 hyccin [Nilaparvata lugens]XP_039292259.1 hyccin [Nilaparvata lugens]